MQHVNKLVPFVKPYWRSSLVAVTLMSTIRDADNVIVIKNGEIVEQGTQQQLMNARGFFHHLYMSQFKGLAILQG